MPPELAHDAEVEHAEARAARQQQRGAAVDVPRLDKKVCKTPTPIFTRDANNLQALRRLLGSVYEHRNRYYCYYYYIIILRLL